jgi:hypothetical protein
MFNEGDDDKEPPTFSSMMDALAMMTLFLMLWVWLEIAYPA